MINYYHIKIKFFSLSFLYNIIYFYDRIAMGRAEKEQSGNPMTEFSSRYFRHIINILRCIICTMTQTTKYTNID